MSAHTGSLPNTLRPGLFFPDSRRAAATARSKKVNRAGAWVCAALLAIGGALALSAHLATSESDAQAAAKKTFAVAVPARVVANFFVVESPDANGALRRFVIDTGSTVTLVSAEFAARFADANVKEGSARIFAPTGQETSKQRVTLTRLSLGAAAYSQVPAVIADLGELSRHLGMSIDGIIGFPVFKHHLLTLDYARGLMTIRLFSPERETSNRDMLFAMRADQRVPYVTLQVGEKACEVLVDTGSDGGLNLNPEMLDLQLAGPARVGSLVATVAGDRRQYLARLAEEVRLGGASLPRPVVDFTLGTPSVGGEVLRNFALTFDQRRREVAFRRVTPGVIQLEARRTVGLSFARGDGAWQVAGVIPETPGALLAVREGDRCVRINGEAVDHWPAERYAALLNSAEKVTFTFAQGSHVTDFQIPVVSLLE